MAKFNALFAFVGIWMLYFFPLYQGALELSEPNRIIKKFQKEGKDYPKVSPWYWLLPPLKIKKEKERGIRILQDSIAKKEIDQLFRYFNKAVAWFYIAVAGVLNGVVATNDLFEAFGQERFWLRLVIDLLLIMGGFFHIRYRFDHRRKERIMTKIFARHK